MFALYKQTNEILNLNYSNSKWKHREGGRSAKTEEVFVSEFNMCYLFSSSWGIMKELVFKRDWRMKIPVNQDDE